MAKIYYRKIKAGEMTIEEVPERWRAAVQALLDADAPKKSQPEPVAVSLEPEITEPEVQPEVVKKTTKKSSKSLKKS